MDKSRILKFLFPEYQIIESVKKHGFIAKKTSEPAFSNSSERKAFNNQVNVQRSAEQHSQTLAYSSKQQTIINESLDKSSF